MILKKTQKNKKFKFEDNNADFAWETGSEDSAKSGNEDYGTLLRNVYNFDPSLHEFDAERFRVSHK
jgi:hypothetical protein